MVRLTELISILLDPVSELGIAIAGTSPPQPASTSKSLEIDTI